MKYCLFRLSSNTQDTAYPGISSKSTKHNKTCSHMASHLHFKAIFRFLKAQLMKQALESTATSCATSDMQSLWIPCYFDELQDQCRGLKQGLSMAVYTISASITYRIENKIVNTGF
jgi:hypothetical protein